VVRDLIAALTDQLDHRLGHYNAMQRLLYTEVNTVICLAVATGLSIWKSVQLSWLTNLFGGYRVTRGLHLAAMICIALFVVVHLVLVVIFPRTLSQWSRERLPSLRKVCDDSTAHPACEARRHG
jgi:thiosulfate reductase cytochrome b subunit